MTMAAVAGQHVFLSSFEAICSFAVSWSVYVCFLVFVCEECAVISMIVVMIAPGVAREQSVLKR
tara:strand:- start:306 stop:497 length:192 start_codon:yes stop_codon:yes gene_type:complete